MTEDKLAPDLRVVAIDETSLWSKDFVKKTGKIWAFYLVDFSRQTYCCEVTPSYEMWFVERVAERLLDEETDIELREVHEGDVVYSHVAVIERLPPNHVRTLDWGFRVPEDEEDYQDIIDEALEDVRGNSVYPRVCW